jgi:hypothetical protein
MVGFLFPNNLHQHPLASHAIELPVEDLLPGAEIQLAIRDRNDHLAPHHLAFKVGVGVVFAGTVVPVLIGGCMRGKFLQPSLIILVEDIYTLRKDNITGVYYDLLHFMVMGIFSAVIYIKNQCFGITC